MSESYVLAVWLAFTSLNPICLERGHVQGSGFVSVTLAGIAVETVDLPDRTLKIVYNPNHESFVCARCKHEVSAPLQTKPDTTVIWIKE